MNTIQIIISALTAFIIAAGGAIGVSLLALKGAMPDRIVWISAIVVGLVSAAKDTRSLMKLPPVNGNGDYSRKPPSVPPAALLVILFGLLALTGCSAPGVMGFPRPSFHSETPTTVTPGLLASPKNTP